jgi:hypothetical protein
MGTALVGFGVRQHARRESISKRAPSTLGRRAAASGPEPDALRTVDCVVEAKAVGDLLIALNNAFKLRESLS